jgi:hypothetical protein
MLEHVGHCVDRGGVPGRRGRGQDDLVGSDRDCHLGQSPGRRAFLYPIGIELVDSLGLPNEDLTVDDGPQVDLGYVPVVLRDVRLRSVSTERAPSPNSDRARIGARMLCLSAW